MNWLSANYRWLFDGAGGVVAIAVAGYFINRLRKKAVAERAERTSLDSSAVISGSGNTQIPIQINQARDVHVGVPAATPAPVRTVEVQRRIPNVQYVDARPICLDGPLNGLYEKRNSSENNAVVIVFANEPEPDRQPAAASVKAVLFYREGENELCDITGSWIGARSDEELFHADGRRHRLVAGVKAQVGFAAIETRRIQQMFGAVFVWEDHLMENLQAVTLFVRLVNKNGGATLWEGRFALTVEPLSITPALEPIV